MCRASHRFSHSVNKSFALDHFSNGLSRQGRKQLLTWFSGVVAILLVWVCVIHTWVAVMLMLPYSLLQPCWGFQRTLASRRCRKLGITCKTFAVLLNTRYLILDMKGEQFSDLGIRPISACICSQTDCFQVKSGSKAQYYVSDSLT